MRRDLALFSALVLLVTFAALGVRGQVPGHPAPPSAPAPAYHDYLPAEPLPATLDPAQFIDNRRAFVAYTLAGETKSTLYQVPCYCGCDKEQGHSSLLDCFTGRHGVLCHICQKEAIYCFHQHAKGKSAAQIRAGIASGAAAKINVEKFTNRFYQRIRKSER